LRLGAKKKKEKRKREQQRDYTGTKVKSHVQTIMTLCVLLELEVCGARSVPRQRKIPGWRGVSPKNPGLFVASASAKRKVTKLAKW
jgi:hypothetical protein